MQNFIQAILETLSVSLDKMEGGNRADRRPFSRYSAKKRKNSRTCRIEELEGREMLSVTPWTLADDYIDDNLQERAGVSPPVENVLVETHRQANAMPLLQAKPTLQPLAAAPENAHVRDMEVYNDLIACGAQESDFKWNDNGFITEINAANRGLTGALDVSGLILLERLDVDGWRSKSWGGEELNQLTSLDVSGCVALKYLSVRGNSGSTKSPGIGNRLETLDVSDCTLLETLRCTYNRLETLDVSQNTALKVLDCARNLLTELDLSQNMALKDLGCEENLLTTLDLSHYTALESLSIGNEGLNFDIADYAFKNTLRALALCYYQPNTLDLSGNQTLEYIEIYNSTLTTVNLSGILTLERAYFDGSTLTTLNLSGCTGLAESLYLDNVSLTNLDVSGCTGLEMIYSSPEGSRGRLETLNASGCSGLRELSVGNNRLSSLNLSGCVELVYLDCASNYLSSLDVSGLMALESLYCEGNNLTTLNLYGTLLADFTSAIRRDEGNYYVYEYEWPAHLLYVDKTVTLLNSPSTTVTLNNVSNVNATKQAAPGTVSISWQAGANHTASTVYTVQYQKNGADSWIPVTNVNHTNRTASVAGLTEGSYVFRVTATESGKTSSTPVNSNAVVIPPPNDATPVIIADGKASTGWKAPVKATAGKKNTEYAPTVNSVSISWTSNAKHTEAGTNQLWIEVYGPKPKGGTAPLLETIKIVLADPSHPTTTGNYNVTTKEVGGVYYITISGLNAGTKYTMNVQAVKVEGGTVTGNSKMAKVSPATLKYAAPKANGKAVQGPGEVTLKWNNNAAVTGTKTYDVGIYDAQTKMYLFAGDTGKVTVGKGKNAVEVDLAERYASLVTNAGIAGLDTGLTGTEVKISGLASMKYTFGVREVNAEDTQSAIAKMTVSPTVYKAPKIGTKQTASGTSFTVKDVPEGVTYKVGVYDKAAKAYFFGADIAKVAPGFSVVSTVDELKAGQIKFSGGTKGLQLGVFEVKGIAISAPLKVKLK